MITYCLQRYDFFLIPPKNALQKCVSNSPMDEEEYVAYLVNNWLTNQEEEFYEIGYYDLGDFYLALER